MILVTGGTGTIGGELLRLLSARDVAVQALSRRGEGNEPLAGVEWVQGDLADRMGLPDVFRGATRLFLLTGNVEDKVRLEENAIRAAVEAGIEQIIKLSALGASSHSKSVIGLWHHNVERVLKESGIAWTILRPHHFMQNLLLPTVFDVTAGLVYSASGEGRIPFLDTRDIAAVAAAVLAGEGHAGETYVLTGPEAISYRQATEILSQVLDRPLTFVAENDDAAWSRLYAASQPPWLIAGTLAIAAYQRAGGPTESLTDTVKRLTGCRPRTLEQFARDHTRKGLFRRARESESGPRSP